jgi:hypothetical protein
LQLQVRKLFWRKAEGEIIRKPVDVAPNLLVEPSRRHAVDCGQVHIEHNLVAADEQDCSLDPFGRD